MVGGDTKIMSHLVRRKDKRMALNQGVGPEHLGFLEIDVVIWFEEK